MAAPAILDFARYKFDFRTSCGASFSVSPSNLVKIRAIATELWPLRKISKNSGWVLEKYLKNHDVTVMTHPARWRHQKYAQSIAHSQVPIGCPLEPSRYMASFPRYLAPKLQTEWRNDRITESQTDTSTDNKGRLKLALANQQNDKPVGDVVRSLLMIGTTRS